MENLKETEKKETNGNNGNLDIKTLNETILKLSNEINELKQFNLKNQNQNSNNKKEDINEKIDKEREAKKLEKEKEERLINEYEFNKKLEKFKESDIFGEDFKDILEEINTRHYDNLSEKNKEIKKTILNRVLKEENKLNYLGETARRKAEKFLTLTDREKLDKAGDYFDYIEFIEDGFREAKRREELKNINGNYNTTSNYFKKFDELLAKKNQNK